MFSMIIMWDHEMGKVKWEGRGEFHTDDREQMPHKSLGLEYVLLCVMVWEWRGSGERN